MVSHNGERARKQRTSIGVQVAVLRARALQSDLGKKLLSKRRLCAAIGFLAEVFSPTHNASTCNNLIKEPATQQVPHLCATYASAASAPLSRL